MRITHLSESDIEGGAARAANRLHVGLRHLQVDSHMLVQTRTSDQSQVHVSQSKFCKRMAWVRTRVDTLPADLYPGFKKTPWGVGWFPLKSIRNPDWQDFDIVHLHWICGGFLPIPVLKQIQKPLVWTLHDMWAFTGGCHYAEDCQRYDTQCGKCPQLGSSREKDLSRWTWNRKAKYWQLLDLTVVTPSNWLADCARRSSLFCKTRIEVIPNGIDTQVYKPLDKTFCRDLLNLPHDRSLVLFGAIRATSDQRKGFQYLQPALSQLAKTEAREKVELIVFGESPPSTPQDMAFPVHYLGKLHDDVSMAVLYSAADVVVIPSTEDNLPNVAMEALACGVPCVAFGIGGLPDMIDHQQNGYLATPFEPGDLAQGICWVLDDRVRLAELSRNARAKVEDEFAIEKVAGLYKGLYESINNAS